MASAVHEDDKKSILPDWENAALENKNPTLNIVLSNLMEQ
jgi:hypothetical protein